MANMTLLGAVNDAMATEMRNDDRVVVFGEDVGKKGGVFGATVGLQDEFGTDRCFDTPLSECGIIGTGIGMAVYGMRPVAEIQFLDFIYPAFDQIVSEAAKMRYRSGGEYTCPMVIRSPYGGGIRGGHYHSQSSEAYFCHTPGLKVVIPSTPADAKGLLIASIRDEDPVMFLEPKRIYRTVKGEVPEGEHVVPLSKGRVVREGTDCTVVAYGAMVHICEQAAEQAAKQGRNLEIVDPRTLVPLDEDIILSSVKKTGRCVVVYEAPKTCGYGAEIAALIAEQVIEYLEGPVVRVAGFDTPFPYALENLYMPDVRRILEGVQRTFTW
ncbi:MAG: alpha-ketoacid dehydrogenase subunit beta [Planctomycetes bacterium]|nr:alpha-ketoacid dehydrogenase subunit beta [Planctomycetota bacterium]MCB9871428.1 alpha-ketoacid dehydrogenase subunit beta [Planctomycetota bacterium]MCB9888720.1 alpha-ketoacid dehydrogenase subunit beta [Planctomycetota bacterium]